MSGPWTFRLSSWLDVKTTGIPVPLANLARMMTFRWSSGNGVVLAQVFVPTWWSIKITAVSSMLKVFMRSLLSLAIVRI
jgi:hypothetical protein